MINFSLNIIKSQMRSLAMSKQIQWNLIFASAVVSGPQVKAGEVSDKTNQKPARLQISLDLIVLGLF